MQSDSASAEVPSSTTGNDIFAVTLHIGDRARGFENALTGKLLQGLRTQFIEVDDSDFPMVRYSIVSRVTLLTNITQPVSLRPNGADGYVCFHMAN